LGNRLFSHIGYEIKVALENKDPKKWLKYYNTWKQN
jgi:hypothetical protein